MVAVQQVRELVFNETIDRHMDAIFAAILADICDSEVRTNEPGSRP